MLCQFFSAGQKSYRFISYNVSDGLSQNSVHCIYQDRDGLLWLGTQDGLNSFDGHTFTSYKYNEQDSNTISDQFILSIGEDKDGYVWVGTRNGLNRLNKRTGKFTRYFFNEAERNLIESDYLVSEKADKSELFITHARLPSIITTDGRHVQVKRMAQNNALRLVYDSKGSLWGISRIGHIVTCSPQRDYAVDSMAIPHSVLKDFVTVAKPVIDASNTMWCYNAVNNKSTLVFFDTDTRQWRKEIIRLNTVINHIMITREGTGWVSTLDGIYLVNDYRVTDTIRYDAQAPGLPPGNILCTYQDRQGNIWAGTASSGFGYHHPVFENYGLFQTGIEGDAINVACQANETEVWAGATSGLYRLNGINGQYRIAERFFRGKKISALAIDSNQRIWVAVQQDGLYVLQPDGRLYRSFTRNDTILQTKRILYLLCDSRNRVYVCAESGVFIYDNKNSQWHSNYQYRKDTTGWYTLHAFEDRDRHVWLSKHLGVDVYNDRLERISVISSRNTYSPLKRTIVTSITQGGDGDMWIATLSSGIYHYHEGKLKQYTTADGLNSNVIYGINSDALGRIWATTTSGINVFVPAEQRFYSLSTRDGLPADDYVIGALFRNNKGNLLIGSSKGLITVTTRGIKLINKAAEARIADVKINGESIESLTALQLPHDDYTFTFRFSVREALQPRNIIYQYRINGVDKEWNTLSAGNDNITYTNLPYKRLVMEVRAAYALPDIEKAATDSFVIEIEPPIWQTAWFRVLAVVLCACIVFLAVRRYHTIQYRKQVQAMQVQKELQQERERISRDLHDNMGAYTSALIAGVNRLKAAPEQSEKEIGQLGEYAANIMGYLRETIWLLNHEELTLTAFADRFKNYAQKIIRNYTGITLQVQESLTEERHLQPQVSLNLFRMLQEALQNACKHAQASVIEIGISSNEIMRFYVKDDGIGIAPLELQENYGMQNMRQRATESGFAFEVIFGSGTGTCLLFTEHRKNSANAG
jgi:ligand-binding sensor domain-containing protein/signal transduction histidine kinase